MPLTAGPACLLSKLTGMPSAMKLDVTLRSIKRAAARYSRRSVRIREINRMNIAKAPAIHITASTAALRPSVMSHTGPPIAPSG